MRQKRDSIYIDYLPTNAIEFVKGRYWIDKDKQRLIMKPKGSNSFKVVQPLTDAWHPLPFVYLYINGKSKYFNFNKLMNEYNKLIKLN